MFLYDQNETIIARHRLELYAEIITRFMGQGAKLGTIYGAGVGVLIWIIGAFFGAPLGALAGLALGLIDGVIIGYLVVYHDMPFATMGSMTAGCMTACIVIIGAIVLGVFNSPSDSGPMPYLITLFLAIVAGFATWQGSHNVAEWYEIEVQR